ncbi:GatB/YqeY domain-containing protein [Crucibulum laeve]|uniref:Altered inheritance of mitochondria protein 41 n=1 Tax=Crucibulum laeve TaxID=68775 RepID=A0A5C3MH67_9AGAR|nr:GatB/YqeY domain-containing protein [Crucibulum laeve]
MKRKDSFTSTTLRCVLSDVYNADKTASNGSVTSSDITGILRKAVQRRMEAAHKFEEASRPELAENEKKEAEILSEFLPPLLSEAAIDQILQEALKDLSKDTDSRKSLGLLFKSFYSKVDKSTVDADLVRKRAEILLAARSAP